MLALFISLVLLGLSAIDPIGIAAMPILLVQKHPYKRSVIFLFGSFMSLMLMGMLFAKGFGHIVLAFEDSHTWIVPVAELTCGLVLIIVSTVLTVRIKKSKTTDMKPSARLQNKLKMGTVQLFLAGALLVAVQSIVDVVFLVAMIHVGQLHMNIAEVAIAVFAYTISALLIQISCIIAYRLAPTKHKTEVIKKIHILLNKYAERSVVYIGYILGLILIVIAIFKAS